MKKNIDVLMKKMKIDAIYAEGASSRDTTMYYLLNGINITGHYLKKRGKPACIIHHPIEREEAKKTGLRCININTYNTKKIYERYKDPEKAHAVLTKRIFDNHNVQGRVVFYGNSALGSGYVYLRQLIKLDRKIQIVHEQHKSLITRARETKDEKEIDRIKKAGSGVTKAFNAVINAVRNMKVKNEVIVKRNGKKLLIGDLKNILRKELYAHNLFDTAGMIVAQGRDAGVPHNSGKDREVVKLGKTIVFDIYPQERGGGYFFDFTRTMCFGYAPKNIIEHFRIVREAQDYALNLIHVGKRTVSIERKLCTFFEKMGHTTFLSNPKTQSGYCHSLGHGIGLNVHESPAFGLLKTNTDTVTPGMVFTVEPGLYYPQLGFGIRLEDVVYVSQTGKIINLTKYHRNLVVEL
jgi:Xaa-Pro aminopeptidase